MQSLKKPATAGVILSVAILAMAAVAPMPAHSGSTNPTVTVVNTPTNPVNSRITNSVLTVEVSNGDPVPVTVASLPPILAEPSNRYQLTQTSRSWTTSGAASYINFDNWAIPSGKILILEQVSIDVAVNPGEKARAKIECQGGGPSPAEIAFALTAAGTFYGYEQLISTGPVKCYAGLNFFINVLRNSTSAIANDPYANTSVSLVGFLEDEP